MFSKSSGGGGDDVLSGSVLARLLGLEDTVIERIATELDDGELIVHARPKARRDRRCGVCRRRSPWYDAGEGRRRWRALDLGRSLVAVEADAPRVACRDHGVVVAHVPWARHGSRFTCRFEEVAAWMATQLSRSAVTQLLRISWRTVGRLVARVVAERSEGRDPLAGLRRIGIDELSFRRGQRYITVVVNHDTGHLIWAAEGRDVATLERFFEELGKERCAEIEVVSADMGSWIGTAVRRHLSQARLCIDPFHTVQLATDALDEVRRDVWNAARRRGDTGGARWLKGARWALWRNPENLSIRGHLHLGRVKLTNEKLYTAYLLKEMLRTSLKAPTGRVAAEIDTWTEAARTSGLPPFVKLARTIETHRTGILAAAQEGLSNARVEALNTRLRLITRRSFGFHSAEPLIALAMLTCGGLCPPLPQRGV